MSGICPDRRIREPTKRDYQPVSDEVYDEKRMWPSITAVTGHKRGWLTEDCFGLRWVEAVGEDSKSQIIYLQLLPHCPWLGNNPERRRPYFAKATSLRRVLSW